MHLVKTFRLNYHKLNKFNVISFENDVLGRKKTKTMRKNIRKPRKSQKSPKIVWNLVQNREIFAEISVINAPKSFINGKKYLKSLMRQEDTVHLTLQPFKSPRQLINEQNS